jgi:nucleotide-binding universal stress UspA family protein
VTVGIDGKTYTFPVDHGDFELGTDGPSVILVAVDDSVTGLRAGAYAAGLARRQGARFIAVYVVPITSAVLTSAAGPGVLAAEREAHQGTAGELAGWADERARVLGISVAFMTAHGDPYREITRIASETRADALVVGASLQAGHRLMGSLAVRLVRAGKWPVTVVP